MAKHPTIVTVQVRLTSDSLRRHLEKPQLRPLHGAPYVCLLVSNARECQQEFVEYMGLLISNSNSGQENNVTTEYPPGTTPTGPANVPPDRDGAWGCFWWWWIIIILIILFFWWAGWGWGPSGGYWFRTRTAPQTAPHAAPSVPPATRPAVAPATRPAGAAAPAGPGANAIHVLFNWRSDESPLAEDGCRLS